MNACTENSQQSFSISGNYDLLRMFWQLAVAQPKCMHSNIKGFSLNCLLEVDKGLRASVDALNSKEMLTFHKTNARAATSSYGR